MIFDQSYLHLNAIQGQDVVKNNRKLTDMASFCYAANPQESGTDYGMVGAIIKALKIPIYGFKYALKNTSQEFQKAEETAIGWF